ncbi:hypothetical protein GLOIN_2v264706 [Rhizophagus irregularis DAOM 181602=DAOM 197198]|nr:hypothetical protein GLOIN_2v264706 [Rhizophagus irregularis DAOM 181602=DAOM 197198]
MIVENLYHEAREELKRIKLTSISSEKIRLMSNVLFKKQHKDNEKPIYDPEEFKKMLEKEEPKLQGFFDEFYAGTNPQKKNPITNQQNKKKTRYNVLSFAGFNNKFISDVKEDVGFLLNASGTSVSAIDTLSNAGLTILLLTTKIILIVLNIDDYHNIHTLRRPDTTTTSSALHFIAILMKSSSQVSAIPFNNVTNQLIQNPKGVDFRTKKSFTNLFGLPETYEERTERLLVHSYDIRIAERKNDRSMQNTKLIDLLEGSLHSTKDYISVIQLIANIPELHAYLEGNILVALWIILDRKMFVAVVHRMINGERSDVPPQILNIVPFIGPLHVSLNSWETVFLVDYCFFENMYHAIFNSRKILAKKPKPYLHLRVGLWSKNLSKIFFFNCKYSEAYVGKFMKKQCFVYGQFFIDTAAKIIISCHWHFLVTFFIGKYKSPNGRNSQSSLHIFNDYYVENFHSCIRHQTNNFNTAQQIINQAKIIDQMPVRVSGKRLLDLFQNVWKNRGCTTKKKIKKNWQYNLPTLGKIVDGIQLVSPKSDKLCDWSKCTLSSEEASDNCKIFQNMLNMKFDDDKDNGEVLEDQASLEDNDDNVVVFADEDINRRH